MKVVIMAGGKGTRIASVAKNIPKPMISVAGRPVLEHILECLRSQGFVDIILVIGHLGEIIKQHFGNGSVFGVKITYFEESSPLGTAGALGYLKEELKEDFLLLNGDIIFDVDFQRFICYHQKKGGSATLFTHPNDHPYDSGLLFADCDGKVLRWLHKEDERTDYKNRVNAGLHILSPKTIMAIVPGEKTDLDRDVLEPLISQGEIFVYDSPEYVKDMGTPERYQQVCADVETGKVQAKNLLHKQRAVFLDRDGTINQHKGFLTHKEDFQLLEGAAAGIKLLNQLGLLVIVVTNQPIIARGECTVEELEAIHQRMERLLGEAGAYVDAIYYCPHHPHKGFPGERAELKIDCSCRKPKPGMLQKAAEKYHIDLSVSYMIGDDSRDIAAGKAAGCYTIRLQEDGVPDGNADWTAATLWDAAKIIQRRE